MSKMFLLAFAGGILLGLILIVFTIVNRKKLPGWSRVSFLVIGILMIVACLLMCAGMVFS